MKKLFITALIAIAVGGAAFATPKKLSSIILANFNVEFKGASNVKWVVTDDYSKASFKEGNTKREIFYNSSGDIIASSKSIQLDELPINAKRTFAKMFDGYNVKEAIRFDGFDEVSYYISGENEKESVILKVSDCNQVSMFQKTKK